MPFLRIEPDWVQLGTDENGILMNRYFVEHAVPEKPIEALSLSDYNHLREILGLSPVVMGKNEFLVHCDTSQNQ